MFDPSVTPRDSRWARPYGRHPDWVLRGPSRELTGARWFVYVCMPHIGGRNGPRHHVVPSAECCFSHG